MRRITTTLKKWKIQRYPRKGNKEKTIKPVMERVEDLKTAMEEMDSTKLENKYFPN